MWDHIKENGIFFTCFELGIGLFMLIAFVRYALE